MDVEPGHIAELVGLLQSIMGDASGGTLGMLGIATLVAKYSVDVLRSGIVQSLLSSVGKAVGMKPGALLWARWSPATRKWVSLIQSFVLALLPSLAVASWPTAIVGALVAAFGTKGIHDASFLPGRKPTVYESTLGRSASLRTPPAGF